MHFENPIFWKECTNSEEYFNNYDMLELIYFQLPGKTQLLEHEEMDF